MLRVLVTFGAPLALLTGCQVILGMEDVKRSGGGNDGEMIEPSDDCASWTPAHFDFCNLEPLDTGLVLARWSTTVRSSRLSQSP